MMKKTPLYEKHLALNAKIIDFGGWAMPVQYTGVIEEHNATRNAVSVFDICHMGEIEVRGPQALELLQFALTRDLAGQKTGRVRLALLLNDHGGIIDDLTVYKMASDRYILVTNAARRESDYHRLQSIRADKKFDCKIEDISDKIGKVDLQGPRAQELLRLLTDTDLDSLGFYFFCETKVAKAEAILSRSGYTGEDGFEIYAPADKIGLIWDELIAAGIGFGLKPAGLGARDTLRLECAMMLNGQDMTEETSPLEVTYGWLVDWGKNFAGKDAAEAVRDRGIDKKLVGFEMTGRGIARHGYHVFKGERQAGIVTSGTFSPTLNRAIGLAFVDISCAAAGTELSIIIRDRQASAKVVKLPFYKREKP
jgi:aminomethyltransferase